MAGLNGYFAVLLGFQRERFVWADLLRCPSHLAVGVERQVAIEGTFKREESGFADSFKRPDLLLLERSAAGRDLVLEGLGSEVLVVGEDETDGPLEGLAGHFNLLSYSGLATGKEIDRDKTQSASTPKRLQKGGRVRKGRQKEGRARRRRPISFSNLIGQITLVAAASPLPSYVQSKQRTSERLPNLVKI